MYYICSCVDHKKCTSEKIRLMALKTIVKKTNYESALDNITTRINFLNWLVSSDGLLNNNLIKNYITLRYI